MVNVAFIALLASLGQVNSEALEAERRAVDAAYEELVSKYVESGEGLTPEAEKQAKRLLERRRQPMQSCLLSAPTLGNRIHQMRAALARRRRSDRSSRRTTGDRRSPSSRPRLNTALGGSPSRLASFSSIYRW